MPIRLVRWAAALIMIAVFLAFVAGEDAGTKMFGLGLATAILVDATVVRMVLVPATMRLLGDANWWLPGWLSRVLPTVDVEREDTVADHAEVPRPRAQDAALSPAVVRPDAR